MYVRTLEITPTPRTPLHGSRSPNHTIWQGYKQSKLTDLLLCPPVVVVEGLLEFFLGGRGNDDDGERIPRVFIFRVFVREVEGEFQILWSMYFSPPCVTVRVRWCDDNDDGGWWWWVAVAGCFVDVWYSLSVRLCVCLFFYHAFLSWWCLGTKLELEYGIERRICKFFLPCMHVTNYIFQLQLE